MTEKLFYDDPYATEFDAQVVRVLQNDGSLSFVLDRTCFYPEGGGQPCDHGEIARHAVIDVQKSDDDVVHIVSEEGAPVTEGGTVHASIDWKRRHDYMQQHTGQHVISAALLSVGGHNTVSVHQGEEYTTVEVDSDTVPPADIDASEALANSIICRNQAITDHWVTDAEIGNYPLRRPPKVSGSIRLVMISDFDCVACGGVHLHTTGEVGLVKCIGNERIRGRVRTIWKIGDRAYADFDLKHRITATLGQELSAQPADVVERFRQTVQQLADARRDVAVSRTRIARLITDELIARAGKDSGKRVITRRFEREEREVLRAIAEDLSTRSDTLFCLVNVLDEQLQWVAGAGSGAALQLDFSMVRGELLPLIDGKGGGKPPIYQGVGNNLAGADGFLAEFARRV